MVEKPPPTTQVDLRNRSSCRSRIGVGTPLPYLGVALGDDAILSSRANPLERILTVVPGDGLLPSRDLQLHLVCVERQSDVPDGLQLD